MRKRVMLAPDSFKGSLGADAVAAALARGMPGCDVDRCPMSDGGEGFRAVVQAGMPGAAAVACAAVDVFGVAAVARGVFAWDGRAETAVVELAEGAGLAMVPGDARDPTRTTTYAVGEMLSSALARGAKRLVLGIGGSATNDGACGAAQALGVGFIDAGGNAITRPITGGMLQDIARIDPGTRDARLDGVRLRVACDVTNPLTGPRGAARVYGPQKGATPEQVERLDAGLRHVAELWRRDCGVDVGSMPGAGAAGGFGGGAVAMLGATLEPGLALAMEATRFRERLAGCDLCITGEGRLDGQSVQGKVVGGVLEACKAAGVPCVAVAGRLGEGWERVVDAGLVDVVEIGRGLSDEEAFARTGELLTAAARRVAGDWLS